MMTPHAQLIHDIREAVGMEPDVVLWVNVSMQAKAVGRTVRTGLTYGAADLIGIGPHGRLLAIEAKAGRDTVKPHQLRFLELVNARGGDAGVARSVTDMWEIVKRVRARGPGDPPTGVFGLKPERKRRRRS